MYVFILSFSNNTHIDDALVFLATSGNQPGNPAKAVRIVIDVLKGEGVTEGKAPPVWLMRSVDCFDTATERCEKTLEALEEWKEVWRSTDFSTSCDLLHIE